MEVLIENRDLQGLKEYLKKEKKGSDESTTMQIDQLIRKRSLKVANCPSATKEEFARRHFHFVMQLLKQGLCSKLQPITTLQDFLETASINESKQLFSIVEEHMSDFKQPPLSDVAQNAILRMCNDLLRRLSRSAETSFCGRIMFFLSRYLPLTEKSGINLMGNFNTQKVTVYEQLDSSDSLIAATSRATPKLENEDEKMDTGEVVEDSKELQVSPEMYSQFWSLQTFFSNPNLIFEKEKYLRFKKDLTAVMAFLASNKLEKSSAEDEEMERKSKRKKLASDDLFFSKYLTSPKLLALQLADSQLRRYFLLQCLIVFQYFLVDSKMKVVAKKMVLADDQIKYINESEDKCYKLLGETMPKGSTFVSICRKVLQRELEWNNWKNIGCPDMSEKADKSAMMMYKKRPRVNFNPDSLDLGTPELTKLWNNELDTLSFLKTDARKFKPTVADFIRDPLDEMDPEQQVEEQYKSINEPSFQWRASRLLITKSPAFIAKGEKDMTTNMREFLERTMYNMAKNMNEFKDEIAAREQKEADARKKVEESLKRKLDEGRKAKSEGSPAPSNDPVLTDDNLATLAAALSNHAHQLAAVFGKNKEETEAELKGGGKGKAFCLRLLKEWTEKHGKTGKKLLNTLISDVEVVEVASRVMKFINFSESKTKKVEHHDIKFP